MPNSAATATSAEEYLSCWRGPLEQRLRTAVGKALAEQPKDPCAAVALDLLRGTSLEERAAALSAAQADKEDGPQDDFAGCPFRRRCLCHPPPPPLPPPPSHALCHPRTAPACLSRTSHSTTIPRARPGHRSLPDAYSRSHSPRRCRRCSSGLTPPPRPTRRSCASSGTRTSCSRRRSSRSITSRSRRRTSRLSRTTSRRSRTSSATSARRVPPLRATARPTHSPHRRLRATAPPPPPTHRRRVRRRLPPLRRRLPMHIPLSTAVSLSLPLSTAASLSSPPPPCLRLPPSFLAATPPSPPPYESPPSVHSSQVDAEPAAEWGVAGWVDSLALAEVVAEALKEPPGTDPFKYVLQPLARRPQGEARGGRS